MGKRKYSTVRVNRFDWESLAEDVEQQRIIIGIDVAKVPLTYPKLGNTGPAAVPLTLAQEADSLNPGDRVLCLGMGSGINAMALEIVW